MLADVCEVPAPEAAACVVFGSAGTDFGSDSIPFDVDLPALAFEALASTCERGVNTIGVCPRSSVGRQGAPAVEALAVEQRIETDRRVEARPKTRPSNRS